MWRLEVTDTFGGEANYCWVTRGTSHAKTSRGAVRALKALMGITGQHADVDDYDIDITVRPTGRDAPCIIGFATWEAA